MQFTATQLLAATRHLRPAVRIPGKLPIFTRDGIVYVYDIDTTSWSYLRLTFESAALGPIVFSAALIAGDVGPHLLVWNHDASGRLKIAFEGSDTRGIKPVELRAVVEAAIVAVRAETKVCIRAEMLARGLVLKLTKGH